MSHTQSDIERFWSKTMDVPGGCLLWRGSYRIREGGYGCFWVNDRLVYAHRFSLELKLGRPILPGLKALHSCDNKACVASAHLREGTARENSIQMAEAQRIIKQAG